MSTLMLPAGDGRDEPAAARGQEGDPDMAREWITAWNGHAALIDGTWRLTLWRDRRYPLRAADDARPGAQRGAWRYDAPAHPGAVLAAAGCPEAGRPIPGAVSITDDRGRVIDVIAPMVAFSSLADADAVRQALGWSKTAGTLSTNLSRGLMVRPALLLAGAGALRRCGAWPWAVVDDFRRWRPPLA